MSSAHTTVVIEPNEPVPSAGENTVEAPSAEVPAKKLPRKRPRLGLSAWRMADAPGWRSTFLSY